MKSLEVRLFGGVRVTLNGMGISPLPTRWAAGLLAYLALNKGHILNRDVLTTLFWPEDRGQRARKAFRNALWRVRSCIEPPGVAPGSFLMVTGRDVGLREEGVWLDVADFDDRMAALRDGLLDQSRMESMEECVRLYRGDLMDGHDHEWATYERERLRLSFLSALEHLLRFHMERNEWFMALQRGRRVLKYDPLREHVHRWLMVCHHLMGDRPLAVRQYQECEQLLEEEMGLPPMEATRALFRDIERDRLLSWGP